MGQRSQKFNDNKAAVRLRQFFIFSLFSSGVLCGFFFLSLEKFNPNELLFRPPVGSVKYAGLNAERRSTKAIGWQTLSPNDLFFNNDRIRTGSGAGLHWAVGSEHEFRMAENTMMEIEDSGSQLIVRLLKGRLFFSGTASVMIKLGQTTVRINHSEVMLDAGSGTDLSVSVYKGTVFVQTPEKSFRLGANEVFAKNIVQKNSITLESPSESEVLHSIAANDTVNLKWSSSGTTSLTWEVSRDAEFQDVAQTGKSTDGQAVVSLASGVYYWRVLSDRAENSVTGRFTLIGHQAISLDLPTSNLNVNYWRQMPALRFEWSTDSTDGAGLMNQALQISETRDFSGKPISVGEGITYDGKNNFHLIVENFPINDRKELFWRIATIYGNAGQTHYSDSKIIRFTKKYDLNAPSLFYPSDTVSLSLRKFIWRAVADAADYRVFIWPINELQPAQPAFVTRRTGARVPSSVFRASQKEYQWTVVAADVNGRLGEFARKRKFTLTAPEVKILKAPKIISAGSE